MPYHVTPSAMLPQHRLPAESSIDGRFLARRDSGDNLWQTSARTRAIVELPASVIENIERNHALTNKPTLAHPCADSLRSGAF